MEKGIQRTCRAIKTRLTVGLSICRAVISHRHPLWKPFKCQLIGLIVLEMTESSGILEHAFLVVCLVPLIDKILLFREETAAAELEKKKKGNVMGKSTFPEKIVLKPFKKNRK